MGLEVKKDEVPSLGRVKVNKKKRAYECNGGGAWYIRVGIKIERRDLGGVSEGKGEMK